MGQMGVEAGRALMSFRGWRGRGRGGGRAGMVRRVLVRCSEV